MSDPWGWQLIVDCFDCPVDACCNLDNAYEFLDSICSSLQMTKQTQPYVFKTCEKAYPGRAGLSGWVPIIESGIQIHTSASKRFVSIDVYSCRPYDRHEVEAYIRSWFTPTRLETTLIERGHGLAGPATARVSRFVQHEKHEGCDDSAR